MDPEDVITRLRAVGFALGSDGVAAWYFPEGSTRHQELGRSTRLVHDELRGGENLEGFYVHPEGVVTAFKQTYKLATEGVPATGTAIAIGKEYDQEVALAWRGTDEVERLVLHLEGGAWHHR